MSNVRHLKYAPRPRTFTSAEELVEHISRRIITDHSNYRQLAEKVGVSHSTIGSLANRKTCWPRPSTLFPLLAHYGMKLRIEE